MRNDDVELNTTLSEKYSLIADMYSGVSIDLLPFSNRVINRFKCNGISSVYQLLQMTPYQLMKLKGFGQKCLDEIENICIQLKNRDNESSFKRDSITIDPKIDSKTFLPYVESIALGDFSFADEGELSELEKKQLCLYKDAYEILGEELVFDCIVAPEKITPIQQMLENFLLKMQRIAEASAYIDGFSSVRQGNKAYPYIFTFTLDDEERNTLKGFCKKEDTVIREMLESDSISDDKSYMLFLRFLKWCSFDIHEDLTELFKNIYVNDSVKQVVHMRANRKTLEQIGSEMGVTRERVRQIEAKAKRKFSRLHSKMRIIFKISAERNRDRILTASEIEEYCGEYTSEFLYLLRSYDGANFTYDQHLDVVILGDGTIQEQVVSYIELLPDVIKIERLPEILNLAEENEGIPKEILEKAFLDSYKITGNLYHRYKLSLNAIYEAVLKEYYPNGLKVYDPNEISKFRDIISLEYGDVGVPLNNRALVARITRICVLCDRGTYKLKQKSYISKELAEKIYKYITESDSTIFMTNTIYSVFEEELNAAGVTNKYYLQGILHELFGEEFIFRRDYLSKDASVTSVYSAIVEFIKCSPYPVERKSIQSAFPGITEIVINLAISDRNILNYFGEYLHVSHLQITEYEKQYLYNFLQKELVDGRPHHCKDIYEKITCEKPEIFSRNAALYQFSAFSVLEYLFCDDFQFSRPYIAQNGIDIGRPAERLHELIYSTNEVEIAEINDFLKENHYQIHSILEYVNSCNDEYLLINSTTMMRISSIGITEEMATNIEDIIVQHIDKTTPICELSVWSQLPKLKIKWTEWLLYSVINKWGKRLVVSTSSNQLRRAVPLIAPVGSMDETLFMGVKPEEHSNCIKIDDLDNIDAILENIFDEDMLKEEI